MHGSTTRTANYYDQPFGLFKYRDDIYMAIKYKIIKRKL